MNSERPSKRLAPLSELVVSVLIFTSFQAMAGSVDSVNLQCECRINPLGIDMARPRLYWCLESVKRDQGWSAYKILVTAGKKLLACSRCNLWDSGRVPSDETVGIVYSGKSEHRTRVTVHSSLISNSF
jgi:alpha-L-rhamnosidase